MSLPKPRFRSDEEKFEDVARLFARRYSVNSNLLFPVPCNLLTLTTSTCFFAVTGQPFALILQ
jgi:hypothetical protein